MTGAPLLELDDPKFPPYFRLFWHETTDLIHSDFQLRDELLKILCRGDENWFTYCTEVFANPRAAFDKYAKKEDRVTKKAARGRNTAFKPEDEMEKCEREKAHAQAEVERKNRMAAQGYSNVLSTLVYEAQFDLDCIQHLDAYVRRVNKSLWNTMHLCDCGESDPPVEIFFTKFYRNEDTLDQLAVSFQSLKELEILEGRGFGNCFNYSRPNSSLINTMDHRIRYFLRELPRVSALSEKIFFSEIIRRMMDGDHAAALQVLFPDYVDILSQKEAERRNLNNARRNLLAKEEMVSEEEHLEMRAPPQRDVDPDEEELVAELVLRPYQEELVEKAVRGKEKDRNTIIVAPTGSGKTEVAIHIAKKHLEERGDRPGRVVMLVPRIPLVEQQQARFRQYLRHRYDVRGFHGAMSMPIGERHRSFLKADIIVMTPEILWNTFRAVSKNERIYLADISLLIFDEIHHCTKKHAYNSIMQFIHDYKHPEVLPQIVGLSASPLPTNVTDEKAAMIEIYKLLANANCYSLSTVVEHEADFETYFSKPDEEYVKVVKPSDNEFEKAVELVIGLILREILLDIDLVKDTKTPSFFLTPTEAKLTYRGLPEKFNGQLENLKQKLKRLAKPEMEKMKLFVALDYLQAIAKSLSINELLPCYFAFDFLEVEMTDIREKYGNNYSDEIYAIFAGQYSTLEGIAADSRQTYDYEEDREMREKKPIVEALEEKLAKNFEHKPNTQCIIFVSERATAKRLADYLSERNIKNTHNKIKFITSSRDRDGMSPDDQRRVLDGFRDGDVQIIVATSILDEGIDVPACNLVIKYNLGSTARERIQRAGRARARDSKAIFICLSESEAEKEFAAIVTIHIMKRCVKRMIEAGPAQSKFDIDKVKRELAENRARQRAEEEENRQKLQDRHYEILCRACERVLCDSNGIRVDGTLYCVVNVGEENIWNNLGIGVTIKKGKKFVDNYHQLVGSVFCLGRRGGEVTHIEDLGEYSEMRPTNICNANLGYIYKIAGAYFPVLGAKDLAFRLGEEGKLEAAKNWSKAAEMFYIGGLIDSDIRTMLNALTSASPNQAVWQAKLDATVERIAALYEKDKAKLKAEMERRKNRGSKAIYVPHNEADNESDSAIENNFSDKDE